MQSVWARGRLASATAVVLLAGCDPAGLLLVDLRTDLRSPDEITHARVRVRSSAPGVGETERWTDLPAGTAVEPVRLVEVPSLPPGDVEITVDLFEGAQHVVGRVVLVAGYRGELRVVTVLVSRACRDAACPREDDPEATQCLSGRCVLPGCTPETPELCPVPECDAGVACANEGTCWVGRCIEGTCFAVADDARCPSGMRCSDEGLCAATDGDGGLSLDAGPGDGGPALDGGADGGLVLDGGADGGPAPDGGVDGGSADDGGVDGGSADGGGSAGDGGSADGGPPPCEPADCEDADPCTDDVCVAGVCRHPFNTAACDDGLFCDGADSCNSGACSTHTGDPCGGAAICDEGGDRCTGCLVTADCGPPVLSGWSVCGGFSGTCDSTGTQSQTTTTFTCTGGTCVGSDTTESRACARTTEGTSCGTSNTCCSGACVSTATSLSHCGGCGRLCDLANAASSCVSGSCRIGSCDAGWGNCNATISDGCEQSLTTASNCGGCGASCATNEACNASLVCHCGTDAYGPGGSGQSVCTGTLDHAASERCQGGFPRRCVVVSCDAGYANCDGSGFNGCEVTLATDPSNCGACRNACGPGETCSGGRCYCGSTGGATTPACSGGQTCRSCGCVPPTETTCTQASPDEDCDGLTNCADPDCVGRLCRAFDGRYCTAAGTCE